MRLQLIFHLVYHLIIAGHLRKNLERQVKPAGFCQKLEGYGFVK